MPESGTAIESSERGLHARASRRRRPLPPPFLSRVRGSRGPDEDAGGPGLSADHVAFVYGSDVWTAASTGRRRPDHVGPRREERPRSARTTLLAFSAELDGNVDVYVVPTAGGVPKRLTWHPNNDVVRASRPTGRSSSPRRAGSTPLHATVHSAGEGGLETKLPIPNANERLSRRTGRPSSTTRLSHLQWKHYRGGPSRCLLFDNATTPWSRSRSRDALQRRRPDVGRREIYFRSDRDGEFNLYAYDPKTKSSSSSPPTRTCRSSTPRRPPAGSSSSRPAPAPPRPRLEEDDALKIGVAADLLETRPRWAKGAKWVRDACLSPSGARVAFEFRGEIVTVPTEKGDPRNLTHAGRPRALAGLVAGRQVDRLVLGRERRVRARIGPQDGKGAVEEIKVAGAGFYDDSTWSPDGKKIASPTTPVRCSSSTWRPASRRRSRPSAQHACTQRILRALVARLEVGRVHAHRPDLHPHGNVYSVDQEKSYPADGRPHRRRSPSSTRAGNTSTSSPPPTPARCATGSPCRTTTRAPRTRSTSRC